MAINKTNISVLGNVSSLGASASYTTPVLNTSYAIAQDIKLEMGFSTFPSAGGVITLDIYDSLSGQDVSNYPVYSLTVSPSGLNTFTTFPINTIALQNIQQMVTNNTDQPVQITVSAITTVG